jgi:hypothetical protein
MLSKSEAKANVKYLIIKQVKIFIIIKCIKWK